MDEDTQGKVEGVAMNVYEKLPEIPKKDRVWYMTTDKGIMRDGDIALMVDGKCYRGSREELRKHCKKELKQFLRDMRNCEGGRGKPHACPICGKVIFNDDDVYCEKHHEEGRRITRAQAENCEKYLNKGNRVAIEGRIQTGSYQNKNGDTVYTTDVVASRVEFLESRNAAQRSSEQQRQPAGRTDQRPASRPAETQMDMTGIPPAFEEIEDDVPF